MPPRRIARPLCSIKQMKKIDFIPLIGVRIDTYTKVEFGITKSDLMELIGKPSKEFDNELYFDELELHIDLDERGEVEFIESIMGPYPEKTEISINGINPFKTKDTELIEFLTELNNGEIDISEAEYGYSFIDKSISLYRSSTVQDIQEMIEEMKSNNDFEDQKEDALFELEKSHFFWTFGIGKKGYYDYLK